MGLRHLVDTAIVEFCVATALPPNVRGLAHPRSNLISILLLVFGRSIWTTFRVLVTKTHDLSSTCGQNTRTSQHFRVEATLWCVMTG